MLKVMKLYDDTKLPVKAKNGDAGFDVFSMENITIYSMKMHKFGLGFAVEFPEGHVLLVQEKSGMASRGIFTIGNVIDSGYRGECHVMLFNLSSELMEIKRGQKIAQILLLSCYTGDSLIEVNKITPTERGDGGFGSTGL